jgi:hypothetical protein
LSYRVLDHGEHILLACKAELPTNIIVESDEAVLLLGRAGCSGDAVKDTVLLLCQSARAGWTCEGFRWWI